MIRAYLLERLPLSFFGPLALIIALSAVGRPVTTPALALAVLGGLFLLAEFRIWDDIADRRKDAIAHPGRVLVRAASQRPVVALGMGLLAVNAWAATERGSSFLSILLLAALHILLAGYYLRRRGRTVLGDQVLLLKYPAFVCILAGDRLQTSPLPVALAAAIVYAAASGYEAWHDPVSPLAHYLGGRS